MASGGGDSSSCVGGGGECRVMFMLDVRRISSRSRSATCRKNTTNQSRCHIDRSSEFGEKSRVDESQTLIVFLFFPVRHPGSGGGDAFYKGQGHTYQSQNEKTALLNQDGSLPFDGSSFLGHRP